MNHDAQFERKQAPGKGGVVCMQTCSLKVLISCRTGLRI